MNTTHLSPLPYSSIGRRFIAFLLDAVIVTLGGAVAGQIIPILGSIVFLLIYAPMLESSEVRATIGKHLMGVQVTDLSGGRISYRTALIRYGMQFVSSVLLFSGYIFAFFTERRQTLHDLVAETVVVYGRSERSVVDAWVEQLKSVFRGQASIPNSLSELERLQQLKERGALSEEEFQVQKKKILGA